MASKKLTKKEQQVQAVAELEDHAAIINHIVDEGLNPHTKIKRGVHPSAEKNTGNDGTSIISKRLKEAFSGINWLFPTVIKFRVSKECRALILDVDFPEIEHMPDSAPTVKKTSQTLETKKRKSVDIKKDYLVHIHSIVLRLAGESFYHVPQIETVLIGGYTQRVNPKTGLQNDDHILSVIFQRQQWQNLNPVQAAPLDFIDNFNNKKEIKNGELKTIIPFGAEDIPDDFDGQPPITVAYQPMSNEQRIKNAKYHLGLNRKKGSGCATLLLVIALILFIVL